MSEPTKRDHEIKKLAEDQKVSFEFMMKIIKELEEFNLKHNTKIGIKEHSNNIDNDVPF